MSSADSKALVLYVEPDPDLPDIVLSFLEQTSNKLTVRTAHSATAALEMLSETAFDCVLSAYHVPGMDGITFLERVREEQPDLPFVLFTTECSEEVTSEALRAGVTDVFLKGATSGQFDELRVCLEESIEAYRVRSQTTQP